VEFPVERKIYYLYLIRDLLNEKVYVGQTVRPKERWSQHKAYVKYGKLVQYIHRAMNKYGIENFQFETIASCLSQKDADETEILLIHQYDSRNNDKGYNIASGGNHPWNAGLPAEQQPAYGRKHTEEAKKKISENNMGKIMPLHTDEWKKQASLRKTGHLVSEETRRKIGLRHIGMKHSDEAKQKMSDSSTGKIISEETKVKMSAVKIGKTKSEETKAKMSAAKKGIYSGENSYKAKLTWIMVGEIRKEYKINPKVSRVKLSRKYGVSPSTISNIIANRIWVIK
jgi:group I intron endonuclease